jgi:hypothetical protein
MDDPAPAKKKPAKKRRRDPNRKRDKGETK